MIWLALLWGVLAGAAVEAESPALRRFETTAVEMAIPIRVLLYAPDAQTANRGSTAALAEIHRLNSIFSDYDAASEARILCDGAKVGVRVSDDLFRVLLASQEFSLRSKGAFDVTVGPLSKLWRRSLRRGVLPTADRLADARSRVGHNLIILDPKTKTVTLLKQDMRLDFGGIAKGYALDAALDVLRRQGIARALIQAGGDIRLGDPPPGRSGWRIGIARVAGDGPPLHYRSLANAAVATSGDVSQYVAIDGRRYSHLIDPRTGWALSEHGIATVIAPDGMTADALASAANVLGPDKGIKLIESFPDVAALVVLVRDGRREVFESARMRRFLVSGEGLPAPTPR